MDMQLAGFGFLIQGVPGQFSIFRKRSWKKSFLLISHYELKNSMIKLWKIFVSTFLCEIDFGWFIFSKSTIFTFSSISKALNINFSEFLQFISAKSLQNENLDLEIVKFAISHILIHQNPFHIKSWWLEKNNVLNL